MPTVDVWFTSDELEKIRKAADRDRITVEAFLERAVQAFLKAHKPPEFLNQALNEGDGVYRP